MVCRLVIGIYILACLAALALVPLNASGAFGMTPDPLSGIFALVLSVPLAFAVFPFVSGDNVWVSLGVAAVCMAVNAGAMLWLCNWFSRRRR